MKNTESINMIIHRVFGFEKDPTHDGHIVETEEELKDFNDKLDDIADRQREAKEVREEDHEEVRKAINFIIGELSNNENIDFDGEKL